MEVKSDDGRPDCREDVGPRVSDGAACLDLTTKQATFVELKRCLATHLRELRVERGLTQTNVARLIGSSQPRVAKMEAADASIDLLVKALLTMGASREQVGHVIAAVA
jgi:predicted XRE-type DNA-binding protein